MTIPEALIRPIPLALVPTPTLPVTVNDVLQTEADSILDFSETNPFGMP